MWRSKTLLAGEVTDFVCPSRELERIIDLFIKAVAIVETWRTEEDFIHVWDEFFQGKPDRSDAKFVYLGWKFEKYIGWNDCFVKNQNYVRQVFLQFHRDHKITVKALLIIDCLDVWAYHHFGSYGTIDESFDFCF